MKLSNVPLSLVILGCFLSGLAESKCKSNKIPKNGQQVKMDSEKTMQECLDKVQEKYPTLVNGAVWTKSNQQCNAVLQYTHAEPDNDPDAHFCSVKPNGKSNCDSKKLPTDGKIISMGKAKNMNACFNAVKKQYPTKKNGAVWNRQNHGCFARLGLTKLKKAKNWNYCPTKRGTSGSDSDYDGSDYEYDDDDYDYDDDDEETTEPPTTTTVATTTTTPPTTTSLAESCVRNKIPKNGQQVKMDTATSMQECLDNVQEKYPTLMNGAVWTKSNQQCNAVIEFTHTEPDTDDDADFCIVLANGKSNCDNKKRPTNGKIVSKGKAKNMNACFNLVKKQYPTKRNGAYWNRQNQGCFARLGLTKLKKANNWIYCPTDLGTSGSDSDYDGSDYEYDDDDEETTEPTTTTTAATTTTTPPTTTTPSITAIFERSDGLKISDCDSIEVKDATRDCSLAYDGRMERDVKFNECFSSQSSKQGWIELYLEETAKIGQIALLSKGNGENLQGAKVEVCQDNQCDLFGEVEAFDKDLPVELTGAPKRGDTIRISTHVSGLTICELIAFAA